MDIKWVGAHKTNWRAGRQVFKPKAIVIHRIDDKLDNSIAGTDAWFNNPVSQVSAHYAISSSGDAHQYVKEEDTAFHAGRIKDPSWTSIITGVNPNLYTIGIEHEGLATSPWPESMLQASTQLVAELCKRYKITPDELHIVGHREIYSLKSCPGPTWDKQAYVQAVAKLVNDGDC